MNAINGRKKADVIHLFKKMKCVQWIEKLLIESGSNKKK